MRIIKFCKSYRNDASRKTASARQPSDFLILRTKRTQGKKTYSSVSLNSKTLLMCRMFQQKAALPALFFPRAFCTFLNNDEYRNSGRCIRHNHSCNRSRIRRMSVSLFSLRQQFFPEKNYASKISQLWSFRVYPCILPGSSTISLTLKKVHSMQIAACRF